MKNIISLIVDNEDIGQRIESFINKNQEKLSRTRIKNLILKKKLKLNNKILDDPSKKISFFYHSLISPTPRESLCSTCSL